MARALLHRIDKPPLGFRYIPDFLTLDEERELLEHVQELPFEAVRMHGVEARRQVVHFGVRYTYGTGDVLPAAPIPPFLQGLRSRVVAAARLPAAAPLEALASRYPPGAGIGWHRDAPVFGPVIAGVSLAGACELRLRLAQEGAYEVYAARLVPRSLYLLSGQVRFRWQHRIPPTPALRYSITFRTIRVAR